MTIAACHEDRRQYVKDLTPLALGAEQPQNVMIELSPAKVDNEHE